jgi:hypothetical protein
LLEIRQKDIVRSMGDTSSGHVTSCSVLQLESESKGHCLMTSSEAEGLEFFWVALPQSFGNDSKIFQDIKQKNRDPTQIKPQPAFY